MRIVFALLSIFVSSHVSYAFNDRYDCKLVPVTDKQMNEIFVKKQSRSQLYGKNPSRIKIEGINSSTPKLIGKTIKSLVKFDSSPGDLLFLQADNNMYWFLGEMAGSSDIMLARYESIEKMQDFDFAALYSCK